MCSGCFQLGVIAKQENPIAGFCTDTPEKLAEAFDRLLEIHENSSFWQSLYVPYKNTNVVDYKSYQNLIRLCSSSRNSKNGFYDLLHHALNEKPGSTFQNIPNTCPWVSILNTDVDRLPVEIPEAQCVCNRCLQKQPHGTNVFRHVPRLGRCKQVMTKLTVLRRHCNPTSGHYEYYADTEKISVGCTCTRPYLVN